MSMLFHAGGLRFTLGHGESDPTCNCQETRLHCAIERRKSSVRQTGTAHFLHDPYR